jgi:hypothetical protein
MDISMEIIKIVGMFSFFAITPLVNAALITETWVGEFSNNTMGDGYLAGEQFSWQITYDNSLSEMTFYSDGVDGLGRTTDDVAERVESWGSEFSADVISSSSFSNIVGKLALGAESVIPFRSILVDNYSAYNDFRWGITSQNQYVKTLDYYQIVANFEDGYKRGNIQYHLDIEGHGIHNFYESFNVISVTSTEVKVNEPSSVALFIICILGLMSKKYHLLSNLKISKNRLC